MVSTLFYGQNGFNVAVDFSGLNNSRTVNYYVYTNAYNANLEYDTSVLFGYPEKRNGLRSVSDNNFIGISADYTYFFYGSHFWWSWFRIPFFISGAWFNVFLFWAVGRTIWNK